MDIDYSMPILIVDDYEMMIRIVRNLLEKIGFTEIDDVNNAESALSKMRASRYGLVISDWNMTPMTGYDFLLAVRADERIADTPFIMITSHSQAGKVIAAREAGADSFLVKPFDISTLRKKIELVCSEATAIV